jgi:putative nucleotidyltransferase with HDIG domain
MKNPFQSFGIRITLAIVASMVTLIILNDSVVYQFTVRTQIEGLRMYLKTIAQTSAMMIHSEYLSEIPLDKEGVNSQAYGIISEQLKRIKAANPQIKYIYILSRTEGGKVWKFVVDLDTAKEPGASPGTPYDVSRFSQMVKSFDQPAADLKLEKDEWGTTLSGYAPIRDHLGKPMAILGVDMDAHNVYMMEKEVRQRSLIILSVGILVAIILGILISMRVVGPVNKLKTGIEYINEGHLHHQVRVVGDDEIAQLAKSFNEMAQGLHESRQKLLNYFYDAVKVLVMLLEARDHYTLGHSEAVAHYSEKIALRLGIDPKTVEFFKRVVLLHDIGKVGVRDNVLLKAGKLDTQEWEVIKLHPVLGEQILKPILSDPLMLSIIRNHHERYDGRGYPDGWSRDQIPLLVAIVTVADSYDAMTSTRSYRQAMTKEQAIEQLVGNRGTQFHPDVVDVFLTILREEDNTTFPA